MNTLARNVPFTLLTLAAVAALIATSWLVAGVAAVMFPWTGAINGWPVRGAAAVLTLALWGLWIGAYRLRLRADTEGGLRGGPVSPPDAVRNRYMLLHVVLVFAYLGAVFLGMAIARGAETAAPRLAGVALPALVLLIWTWEFVRMFRRLDEMMQAAHARALAVAGGVVLLAASFSTLAGMMVDLPPSAGVLLLPLYAVAYAIALGAQGVRA